MASKLATVPLSRLRTVATNTTVVDAVGEVTLVAPGRGNRVALFIRDIAGGQIFVNDDPAVVAQSLGFQAIGTPSIILLRKDIGGAIDNAFFAFPASVAPTNYTVTDIYVI
jgi:hypothetical protein